MSHFDDNEDRITGIPRRNRKQAETTTLSSYKEYYTVTADGIREDVNRLEILIAATWWKKREDLFDFKPPSHLKTAKEMLNIIINAAKRPQPTRVTVADLMKTCFQSGLGTISFDLIAENYPNGIIIEKGK